MQTLNIELSAAAPNLNSAPTFINGNGIAAAIGLKYGTPVSIDIQKDGKILVGCKAFGVNSPFALVRFNPDGSIDTTFGDAGYLKTTSKADMTGKCPFLLQPDGKILVGGSFITRYDANGKIDPSFQTINDTTETKSQHMILQNDGKFLVLGYVYDFSPSSTKTNTIISRYNQNGTKDSTFGSGGQLELNLGADDKGVTCAIQTDGSILISSSVDWMTQVIRLNANGSRDLSFGNAGKIELYANVPKIAVLPDNSFLIALEFGRGTLTRFSQNGEADQSFYLKDLNFGWDSKIRDIEILPDGKILATGGRDSALISFAVARLNSDGTFDTTFNQTGYRVDSFGYTSPATSVAVQPDGKLLIATNNLNGEVSVVRLTKDGQNDLSFHVASTLSDRVVFNGGGSEVQLDRDVRIFDADLAAKNSYGGATLTIVPSQGNPENHVFSGIYGLELKYGLVLVNNLIIGGYSSTIGGLKITFTYNATQDLVDFALKRIAYKNTDRHLTADIQMSWTFDDGSKAPNSVATGVSYVSLVGAPNLNKPTTADTAIRTNEDLMYTFKLSDFVFSDLDVGDSFQSLGIVTAPNKGRIMLKDKTTNEYREVTSPFDISPADIQAGRLAYIPAENGNGEKYASFAIQVSDGNLRSASATVNINVTPTDDRPTGQILISGTTLVGQTLSVSNTISDVDGIGSINYQWFANGKKIEGAISNKLELSNKVAGDKISVQASYRDGGGTLESFLSKETDAITDLVQGADQNDVFLANLNSSQFVGGKGTDTVVFNKKASDYVIRTEGGKYLVQTKIGLGISYSLDEIETIRFSDISLNLSIQNKATLVPQEDLLGLIELYVAFFNRVPDANGLSYWISQLLEGVKLNQIADSFYSVGIAYTDLTGFSKDMSDTDFINTIYRNTLGRKLGADADGLAYWKGELSSDQVSHGSLVLRILEAAHGFKGNAEWGYVADLLDNKISVAKIVAVDWGISYNSDLESINKGIAIAAAVTSLDISDALTLVGINPIDIQL